jgi:hypothetical protein
MQFVGINDGLHGNLSVIRVEVKGLAVNDEVQNRDVPAAFRGSRHNIVDEKTKVFDFPGELGGKLFSSFFIELGFVLVGHVDFLLVRTNNDSRHGVRRKRIL